MTKKTLGKAILIVLLFQKCLLLADNRTNDQMSNDAVYKKERHCIINILKKLRISKNLKNLSWETDEDGNQTNTEMYIRKGSRAKDRRILVEEDTDKSSVDSSRNSKFGSTGRCCVFNQKCNCSNRSDLNKIRKWVQSFKQVQNLSQKQDLSPNKYYMYACELFFKSKPIDGQENIICKKTFGDTAPSISSTADSDSSLIPKYFYDNWKSNMLLAKYLEIVEKYYFSYVGYEDFTERQVYLLTKQRKNIWSDLEWWYETLCLQSYRLFSDLENRYKSIGLFVTMELYDLTYVNSNLLEEVVKQILNKEQDEPDLRIFDGDFVVRVRKAFYERIDGLAQETQLQQQQQNIDDQKQKQPNLYKAQNPPLNIEITAQASPPPRKNSSRNQKNNRSSFANPRKSPQAPRKTAQIPKSFKIRKNPNFQILNKLHKIDNSFQNLISFYIENLPISTRTKIASCIENLNREITQCESEFGEDNCEEILPTMVTNQCPIGYKRIGMRKCVKECPDNYAQLGAICLKPDSYNRRSYSKKKECENYGKKCSLYGVEGYISDCIYGYTPIGKNICVGLCPEGWEDVGKGCVYEEPLSTKLFIKNFGEIKMKGGKSHVETGIDDSVELENSRGLQFVKQFFGDD